MLKSVKAIRGMNDILPTDISDWQTVEKILQSIITRYGYKEVRFPIVESTDLFKRSIGEVTDIVEKEMYTFVDRNGDSLTLRPEGTAGCVRMGLEHGLFHNQIQRLWYYGPMFRHERPQRGRYRQFYQMGVEAYGLSGPDIDVELILMNHRFWHALGLTEDIRLQINSLGSLATRQAHRDKLIAYFEKHQKVLDEDSQRRLYANPLRILDSKNPAMQACIAEAPQLLDELDAESSEHFQGVCEILDAAGVGYEINPRLVRGLDYYTHTVFEWVTDSLGAQGTVCAGGRYDRLVEQLGGRATSAIGFALGLERLVLLYTAQKSEETTGKNGVYVIMVGNEATRHGLLLAEKIRDQLPALEVISNCGGGSFKNQFKRADKSGARMALILGDEEINNNTVGIKFLREEREQMNLKQDELLKFLGTI